MPNTHFGVEKEAPVDLDAGEESIGDLYFTTLVEQLSENSEVSLIDTTAVLKAFVKFFPEDLAEQESVQLGDIVFSSLTKESKAAETGFVTPLQGVSNYFDWHVGEEGPYEPQWQGWFEQIK